MIGTVKEGIVKGLPVFTVVYYETRQENYSRACECVMHMLNGHFTRQETFVLASDQVADAVIIKCIT